MAEIRVRPRPEADADYVNHLNPFPVNVMNPGPVVQGIPAYTDFLWHLAKKGQMYIAADADQNDVVTGQTSFANTTPTFLLEVPSGTTAIPLFANLTQAGTVAGGAIDVFIEIDKVGRWASAGTEEKAFNITASNGRNNQAKLYTGATAAAGYGIMLKHYFQLPQDVGPAVGEGFDWHQIEWKPPVPTLLHGPAALLIYTYAGTTGPSWLWNIGWAEMLTKDI